MAGAIVVSDGVTKTILSHGSGPDVKKGSTITVHCTGILAANNQKFWRFISTMLGAVVAVYRPSISHILRQT